MFVVDEGKKGVMRFDSIENFVLLKCASVLSDAFVTQKKVFGIVCVT